MEDRNRMTNEDDRGRQDQGGKGGARPSPSGVPNEGRRTEGHDSQNQSTISGLGEYRGGRQGQGGVPNPDDVDDDKSAVSFRGTHQDTDVDETDDGPQELAVGQNRTEDLNSDLRNPK
jgi:hypothetical protein